MMRKKLLLYECCKIMLTAKISVEWLLNYEKRNSSMLYGANVHTGKAG